MEMTKDRGCMWFAVICATDAPAEGSFVQRAAAWMAQGGVNALILSNEAGAHAGIRTHKEARPYISMLGSEALRGYLAVKSQGFGRMEVGEEEVNEETIAALESAYDLIIVRTMLAAGSADMISLLHAVGFSEVRVPAMISIDARNSFGVNAAQLIADGLADPSEALHPIGFCFVPHSVAIAAELSRRWALPSWGDGDDIAGLGQRMLERAIARPRRSDAVVDPSGKDKGVAFERPDAIDRVLCRMRVDREFLKIEDELHARSEPGEFKRRAEGVAQRIAEGLSEEERAGARIDQIVSRAVEETTGFGPVTTLLRDEEVTEIMVNGPNDIFIERCGAMERVPAAFLDSNHLMAVIERMLAPTCRRLDEASPMVDARLSDGSRLHAVIPPLALNGPVLTIRKFARMNRGLAELVSLGMLPSETARFLANCVLAKASIVVSGGTGAGKTTLLAALASKISDKERIVTIEDAAELKIIKPNLVMLESRPPNIEGTGGVGIRDLVRNALRMRPDRIVVGECRGAEAIDMLQAMNTGHEGSLTTVHANSPRDAISRLETMVLMAGLDLPLAAAREQIARAVRLIVQVARVGIERKVVEVAEITGMEGQVVCMQTLAQYDHEIRKLVSTGLSPRFAERASLQGGGALTLGDS
ncbi:MAG: CpaF family protein [bacterium]